MAMNFIGCDRDQVFLMPPSLREWVPEDHLVWTVLDAVAEMDLGAFYASYRADGHGRPAYEPSMMVALLLYAYARGNRSSRAIERACVEDVAYRVVAGNLVPDHSTIAEFRVRHEAPLGEVFTSVLSLCQRMGLVRVGVVAIDGTKVAANASREANRGYERIAREILAEAAETDRREDELCPSGCGRSRAGALRCARPRKSSSASVSPSRRAQTARTLAAPTWRASSTRRGLLPAPMAGAPGFARGAVRSTSGAQMKRVLSCVRGLSGLRSRRAGWRRS
jgi:transposase